MNEPRATSPLASGESTARIHVREAFEDEKIARDLACHAAWGSSLTPEQFVARESRLRSLPWSRSSMKTWLLVDENEQVLASCETYAMKSASRSEHSLDEGVVWAIASVFVETHLRKRGYAERLVSSVVERASSSAQAVTLFSEVGTTLYGRSGFVAVPRRCITLAASPGDPAQVVDALIDEASVRDRADSIDWPSQQGFYVHASGDQIDWHLDRERFYTSLLHMTRPRWAGARTSSGWAHWAFSPKASTLIVLGIRGTERDDECSALIECSRRVASSCGATFVEIWAEDIPSKTVADALVSTSLPPVDSYDTIPMIRPISPRIEPAHWRVSRAVWV
ncbi:MAG: GNAT family N-acetyltransferase [Polyangiaceae bacterium]